MGKPTINKNRIWIAYVLPIFFVIVFLLIYFVLPPKIYEKGLSIGQWLASNPDKLLNIMQDKDAVFTPVYEIWCIKIIIYVLWGGFILSLFNLGWVIQNKKKDYNPNAIYKDNVVYLKALELYEKLNNKEYEKFENAKRELRVVTEKLRNESAFGYGDDSIIDNENSIVDLLNQIETKIKESNEEDSAQDIVSICKEIQSKLKTRIELKKIRR